MVCEGDVYSKLVGGVGLSGAYGPLWVVGWRRVWGAFGPWSEKKKKSPPQVKKN
jgi:hypothetical protein